MIPMAPMIPRTSVRAAPRTLKTRLRPRLLLWAAHAFAIYAPAGLAAVLGLGCNARQQQRQLEALERERTALERERAALDHQAAAEGSVRQCEQRLRDARSELERCQIEKELQGEVAKYGGPQPLVPSASASTPPRTRQPCRPNDPLCSDL